MSYNVEFTGMWLKNFLSTGEATQYIPFNADHITLILGHNTDVIGDDLVRNGAGKTTLMQALSYVLYGKPLDNIKSDNLINNINGKAMLVATEFVVNDVRYRIERGRKPAVLKLYREGVDTDKEKAEEDKRRKAQGLELGENRSTQEEIDRIIGMDHLMFTYIVALSANTTVFFKADAAKQREIIERLMGLTQISERAKALKNLVSESKRAVESEQALIGALVEANRRIEVTINQSKSKRDDWDKSMSEQMDAIMRELETIQSNKVDYDAELALFDDIENYDRMYDEYKQKFEQFNREVVLLEREIESLVAENESLTQLMYNDDPTGDINNITRRIENDREDLRRSARRLIDDAIHQARNDHSDGERKLVQAYQNAVSGHQTKVVELDNAKSKLTRLVKSQTEIEGDIAAKISEKEKAHGSDCATCGQALEGSPHLHTISQRIDNQIKKLEEEAQNVRQDHDAVFEIIETLVGEVSEKNERIIDTKKECDAYPTFDESSFDTNVGEVEDNEAIKLLLLKLEEAKVESITIRDGMRSKINDNSASINSKQCEVDGHAVIVKTTKAHIDGMEGSRPFSKFASRDMVYSAKQDHEVKMTELVGVIQSASSAINPYLEQIESLEGTLQEIDDAALLEAKRLHLHRDTLLKLLTQRDSYVRKTFISQKLRQLNERISSYLYMLGLPHSVTFMPDLTVSIVHNDKDYDYDQMSRGEKSRIVLATNMAFRDIWESLNHSVNILWVDELLDNGLCTAGAESALGILKKAARERKKNVFLISHKEELRGRVEKTLMVYKSDGFSEIREDGI